MMGLAQRIGGRPWGYRSLPTVGVYKADPRFLHKGELP